MFDKLAIPLVAVMSLILPSTYGNPVGGMFVIESPQVTNWGGWGNWEYCPPDTFVRAAQLKYHEFGYGDRTSLNGIRLFCGHPQEPATKSISSSVGQFGHWLPVTMICQNELIGFELRSESNRGSNDDTGATDIKFQCVETSPSMMWITLIRQDPPIEEFGRFTGVQTCGWDYAICGIQTQVQGDQGWFGDNTSLNNVRFACCELNPIPI